MKTLIHKEVFSDVKLCEKKKWYRSLGEEMPRICRLLTQDGRLPGEYPYHHVKLPTLQGKIWHAGINLPKENTGKKTGPRTIYVKENQEVIKILYTGGHKDSKYNNSHEMVGLVQERYKYKIEDYIEYNEQVGFGA